MDSFQLGKVDQTAIVSPKATLGKNVTIGAQSIIYDYVSLADNVVVGPNSIIGEPIADYYNDETYQNPPTTIGPNSIIRSGAIIYAGVDIAAEFRSGHRVTIREYTKIGNKCGVGTLCDLQGYCQMGDYVRLHSNVHIGQKSRIGNFVWIFPYTVLTNDPHPPSNTLIGVTVEDFAVIATKVVVLPGVNVGQAALIGAMALVRQDVPSEAVVVGVPAKQVATIHDIKDANGEPVYPWPEHFERGMPWEDVGYQPWKSMQDRSLEQT